MADETPEFPGYILDQAAQARADKAHAAFRQAFANLAPPSLFDTEPQALETCLNRLARDVSK